MPLIKSKFTLLIAFAATTLIVTPLQVTAASTEGMRAAYTCSEQPKFIPKVGMQQPVAIDTQQSLFAGLVVKELRPPKRVFRHPSWDQTGYLASTVRDAEGNIYAVPTPSIGLDKNPLERRNYVYKVDSASGQMQVFSRLPVREETTQANPFGTLGLTLDCDTKVLFVSTVADSTPSEINGVIYRVALSNGEVLSKWSGVDAIGLGIFDHGDGKRLYYGDARSSSVWSVGLDQSGDFQQPIEPVHEFSLLGLKNGNSTQVRKIRFRKDRQHGFVMVASETEFAYRLTARGVKPYRHYKFIRDKDNQRWQHIGFE